MITYKQENIILDSYDIPTRDVLKVGTSEEYGFDYVKGTLLWGIGLCDRPHKSVAFLQHDTVTILEWNFCMFPLGHKMLLIDYLVDINNMYTYIHERDRSINWAPYK